MAVVYIQEFPIADRSTQNYDYVADKVGDGPFEGLIAHTAGFDDEAGVFKKIADIDLKETWRFPRNNAFRVTNDEGGSFM